MAKYFLGNNNLKEIQHGSLPLFGNLAWLLAKNYCYLENTQT